MPNIFAFDYDNKPTQPRDGKAMTRISDSEIRRKVLESKEFAYAAREKLRDELTNEQAALLSYYLFMGGQHESKLLSYVLDTFQPILEKVLKSEVEEYKDKHELNYDPEEE